MSPTMRNMYDKALAGYCRSVPCAPEDTDAASEGRIQKSEEPLMPLTQSAGRTLTCNMTRRTRTEVAPDVGGIRINQYWRSPLA